MLPYRLRPPQFASIEFRAQKLQHESIDEILAGGGPIQRALEKDLMELRPKFLKQLESLAALPQKHLSAGDAFQCFKRVFGDAKVALVHTRTVPPRSDRGAYIQLLYSVCLSLLKRSFREKNDAFMEHAAFAVFCLHALYETCPLPTEPCDPLHSLPMGLQHPDNPKLLYRRTFKSPIRIDRHHYSLLQRLCDQALARHARCQSQRLEAFESRLGAGENETSSVNNESPQFSCTCGVAMDVVEVVNRLLPNLDLVEYTGPVGLEALAGHAEYPYPATKSKKNKPIVRNTASGSVLADEKLTNEELDAIAAGEEQPVEAVLAAEASSLEARMEEYKSNLREIRRRYFVPTLSNQASRIRNALEPIFDQPSSGQVEDETATIVMVNDKLAQHVDVTATPETLPQATIESVTQTGNNEIATESVSEDTTSAVGAPKDPRKSALDELNCELVFPVDISKGTRDAIRATLDLALENSDVRIEPITQGDESSPAASISGNHVEDNDDMVSVDSSTVCGLGAAALRNLFAQVSSLNRPSVSNIPRDNEPNAAATTFGSTFLASNLDSTASPETARSDEHSESSEDSAVSMGVGGMSLQTLWSAVGEEDEQPLRQKRKRKRKRKQSWPSFGKVVQKGSHKRKPGRSQADQQSMDAHGLPSDSEDSMPSNDIGRASLQILLASARSEPVSYQTETLGRKRQRTDSQGERVQGKEPYQDDPPSMSSENLIHDNGTRDGASTSRPMRGEKVIMGRKQGYTDNQSDSEASKASTARLDESASSDDDTDSMLSDTEPSGRAALSTLLSLATKRK